MTSYYLRKYFGMRTAAKECLSVFPGLHFRLAWQSKRGMHQAAYFWPIPLTPRSHASFFAPFRQRRRRRRLARRCVRSHSRRLLHRQQPSISRPSRRGSLPKSTHPACPLPSPSSLIPSCFHAMLAMTKKNLTPLSSGSLPPPSSRCLSSGR